MQVKELIEILSKCNPEAYIATHADNSTYMSLVDNAKLRVTELHACFANYPPMRMVLIGNQSRQNINGINWHSPFVLDGGEQLPREWGGSSREARTVRVGKQPICAACVEDGGTGLW